MNAASDSRLITDESGWLQYHSVGRFPGQRQKMGDALSAFLDSWLALDDKRWRIADQYRRRTSELWGHLVGTEPSNVFTAENVTLAFHAFIEALPHSRLAGRSILIAEDCFPSLHFLLAGLASRIGFRLETVRIAVGSHYVTDDQFIAAWNRDVAVAMVNWVSSVSSKRADLVRLIDHGRHMGSLVAVDITQGIGIVPINVSELQLDFAAATSLKWLCGAPGAGFAHVARHLIDELDPRAHGWFSQPDPSSWALNRFVLAPDARRFGHGTRSVLPFVATEPGLEWVLSQGVDLLALHNRRLCRRLIEIIDRHGLELVSPRNDAERGGSVMIGLKSQTQAEEMRTRLLATGLICDIRGERLRLSPGAVTTMASLEALDAVIGGVMPDVLRARGRSALSNQDN